MMDRTEREGFQPISVTLYPPDVEQADRLAEQRRTNRSALVREALADYLQKHAATPREEEAVVVRQTISRQLFAAKKETLCPCCRSRVQHPGSP